MQAPRTLSPFAHFLEPKEHVIRCHTMYLDGWDETEPPVFQGVGQFKILPTGAIAYAMDAKAASQGKGLFALFGALQDTGDRSSMLRLRGIDYDGREWNAGWVRPGYGEGQRDSFEVFGETLGISTTVTQRSPVSGVELAYSPSPEVPFTEPTRQVAMRGDSEIGWRTRGGQHRFSVLGSEIVAMTEPWRDELWICATTSEQLSHPYLENWLSEPIRALRGQLVYPRLVARNFADGRAFVTIRMAPELRRSMGGCVTQLRRGSAPDFWRFYTAYLDYVGLHRNADGSPEFESNRLTRLHDEVIQARASSSPWVVALCVASAIEGLVKLDPAFAATPADFSKQQIKAARKALGEVEPVALKERLTTSLGNMSQPSPVKYLLKLQEQGSISKEQFEAWRKVRNVVAHGNLFEPWGTQEEHEQLVALVGLFYKLTCIRVGYRQEA